MYISVIIPAYNEENRIKKTLIDANLFLKNKLFKYEILVVNDGSTDGTKEVVESYAQLIPELRIHNLDKNMGKGYAVREGMRLSYGMYKLFMDADNSTSISNLDHLMQYFKDGYDIVISSRQKADSRLTIRQPLIRRILGGLFRKIVFFLVPIAVSDSQNGFKIFTRESANFLFSKQTVFGWAFDVEILALAQKFQFKIKEVGIEWKNDRDSRLKFKGMTKMLLDIITIRLNLLKNKYD